LADYLGEPASFRGSDAARKPSAGEAPKVDLVWGLKVPTRGRSEAQCYGVRAPRAEGADPCGIHSDTLQFGFVPRQAVYFTKNSYAFALVDVRGWGNSEGLFEPFVDDAHPSCLEVPAVRE